MPLAHRLFRCRMLTGIAFMALHSAASAKPFQTTFYGLNNSMSIKQSDSLMAKKGFKLLANQTIVIGKGSSQSVSHFFNGKFASIPVEIQLFSFNGVLSSVEFKALNTFNMNSDVSDEQYAICERWYNEIVKLYKRQPNSEIGNSLFWRESRENPTDIHLACHGEFTVKLKIDF